MGPRGLAFQARRQRILTMVRYKFLAGDISIRGASRGSARAPVQGCSSPGCSSVLLRLGGVVLPFARVPQQQGDADGWEGHDPKGSPIQLKRSQKHSSGREPNWQQGTFPKPITHKDPGIGVICHAPPSANWYVPKGQEPQQAWQQPSLFQFVSLLSSLYSYRTTPSVR